MFKCLKSFAKDDDGAVTVDWVVLTASVFMLGFFVVQSISNGLEVTSENIRDDIIAAGN